MSRILVIHDQRVPRVTVGKTLEEAGHEVNLAENGEEGLRIARGKLPDLILLDVHLPELHGFEVVERLKADPGTARIPVIFLTAEPPTDDLVVRGLELGAYDFLSRKCSRAELLARVGVMMRIKRANDELSALARISDGLIQTLDPSELTRLFVEQVRDVFRTDAVLLSYTAEPDQPPHLATAGMEADRPLCETLAGALRKILEQQGIPQAVIRGEELRGAASVVHTEQGLQTLMATRVAHGDRSPTLLALFSRRPDGFSRQRDARLLHLLARQATIALDNAYLHEHTRAQAAKMEEQAEKLERAITQRSRFFAAMSHELRTPINAVIGYNELLAVGAYGEPTEQQRTAIERLGRSAQHLLELINEILDISKIEAGKMEVNVVETDLGRLLRETIPTVQIQAEEKGLDIAIETVDEAVVRTDPARVRQILLNLLSNAVKFTEEGEIAARVERCDGGYAISVSDAGPGIPDEDRERVFEEFEQTRSGPGAKGTGLGLPISKRLATLLGGELRLSSEIGEGSTFTLVLPECPPTGAEEQQRE